MAYPSLNSLRTFETAARLLSFNKAADELCISPSAVSHQIRQLENTLGVKLFARVERGVTLTSKGEFYFMNVQQGVRILLRATDLLMDPKRSRTIKMSVVPFFATRWLMPRLERFQSLFADWELAIQTSTQKSDFEAEDLDFVIRRGRGNWPNLVSRLLMNENLTPFCATPLAGSVSDLKDLKAAPLLYNSQVPTEWSEFFASLDEQFVAPAARLEFQNTSQILDACIAGAGIALMDPALIAAELRDGRITPALDITVASYRQYYLVFPENHADRQAVDIFLKWVDAELLVQGTQ
ncbi:LysR substrate-binding domain-containing protein [Labrenzia sp. DG1229]|uniref:LysR substrate-binding domain-containing protein n=1 Tax=Labrenzia sp. DG1229 TaxID=681847 RepID=UPI00048F8CA3|nr:LysR substrate-binding domain-containing protein [Labrenzia sp. DG1229]